MRKPAASREATHQCEIWQFDPDWPDRDKPAGLQRCRACGSVCVVGPDTARLDQHDLDDFVDLVSPTGEQADLGVYVLHLHPLWGWVREFQEGQKFVLTARTRWVPRVG